MSKHFLRDYVTFVSGINPTRAKMENTVFYDQNDFMNDYYLDRGSIINNYDKSFKLEEGDVVISLALQQAAIVSKGNHGKILTLNFIKVVFENELLDKYYFVYLFNSYLDTNDIPDPDLMIRTSGEQRLSNYLLWQLAYSEFYFTDIPWPAFTKEELIKAVEEYNRRHRRFGGVEEAE